MHRYLYPGSPLLAVLLSVRSIAQPVLTAADLGYQAGDAYDFIACGPQGFPATGENLSWYYTNLSGWQSGSVTIVDPTSTTGSSFFPTATAADQPPGFPDAQYYAASSTEQLWLGYYHDANAMSVCSDPRIEYTWPLGYGTTFTDSMVCDEPGVFPRVRYGENTLTCVGYGTLVLPYGSFTDCLLLHRHWDYFDDYADIAPGYVEGDAYSFVRAGLHVPLLSMSYSTYTQGDSTIVNQGCTLLSETSTGLAGMHKGPGGLRVLLDQGSGELTVIRSDVGPAQVDVFTAEGRAIARAVFATQSKESRCSLAQAPTGVYFVRMMDRTGSRTVRAVRE